MRRARRATETAVIPTQAHLGTDMFSSTPAAVPVLAVLRSSGRHGPLFFSSVVGVGAVVLLLLQLYIAFPVSFKERESQVPEPLTQKKKNLFGEKSKSHFYFGRETKMIDFFFFGRPILNGRENPV